MHGSLFVQSYSFVRYLKAILSNYIYSFCMSFILTRVQCSCEVIILICQHVDFIVCFSLFLRFLIYYLVETFSLRIYLSIKAYLKFGCEIFER